MASGFGQAFCSERYMDEFGYKEKIKNLKSLIEVSNIISSTFDLPTLTTLIMEIAKKVIKAEAATLMLLDEKNEYLTWDIALGEKGDRIKKERKLKVGEGIAGWVAEKGEPVVIDNARDDPRFLRDIDRMTSFVTKSIICVPVKVKEKTIGILEAMNKIGATSFSGDDLELFTAYASQAGVAIENARLHRELIDKEKIEHELKLAQRIQQSFLPSVYPEVPEFEFYACSLPARSVGGDFYDFIKISENKFLFFIGDVSGKGIPAALYMARATHDFRISSMHDEEPGRVLKEVNKLLLDSPISGLFVTGFYGLLDCHKKKVRFANAGHNPPLLCRNNRCDAISEATSAPLGISEDIKFETGEISLLRGDLFILYTDGVTESMNQNKEQFGLKRFSELVPGLINLSPENVVKEIINSVKNFTSDAPPRDDITLFSLKAL